MKNKIKVCEVFKSIQGEGRYAGYPMLFIRLSGCNRACWFCDTKYHNKGKLVTITQLANKIGKSKLEYVCWTGGEPTLWREQIYAIIAKTLTKKHHLETNGDFLIKEDFKRFDYLAISPKDLTMIKKGQSLLLSTEEYDKKNWDIKIVTDLKKEGVNMIKWATMLMSLTTYTKKDSQIQRSVWDYCTKHNLRFSPRLQYQIWGKKKGI